MFLKIILSFGLFTIYPCCVLFPLFLTLQITHESENIIYILKPIIQKHNYLTWISIFLLQYVTFNWCVLFIKSESIFRQYNWFLKGLTGFSFGCIFCNGLFFLFISVFYFIIYLCSKISKKEIEHVEEKAIFYLSSLIGIGLIITFFLGIIYIFSLA